MLVPNGCRSARGLALAALLGVASAGPSSAQTPTVGTVGDVQDCAAVVALHEDLAEAYAVKKGAGSAYADWQLHLATKGGALVGFEEQDLGSENDASPGLYQFLSGNFTAPEGAGDRVHAFLTLPGGRIAIDSGELSGGINDQAGVALQVVGNRHPALLPGSGLVLPDLRSAYFADLGAGPESFPRPIAGGWEIAWAPLLDVHGQEGLVPEPGCTLAGAVGDDDPVDGPMPWGLLAGYNVYRWPASAGRPSPDELGSLGSFVQFVPVRPDVLVPDSLATLVDPDGAPQTGDEVLVFRDQRANPDGTVRQVGRPPRPGRNYWYAVQPVVMGELADWAALSLAKGASRDYRSDLDGDGRFDSITVSRLGDLPDGAGPTFFSPQAEWELEGLGLTHGGLPLLSPLVHSAGSRSDEDCSNGADDDGDGLADCADGDCSALPDCAPFGGGIRVARPDADLGVIVGWDETLGGGGIHLSRGDLDDLWVQDRVAHRTVGCYLVGRDALVADPGGNLFFLATEVPENGDSASYGFDSQDQRRPLPLDPCP